MSTRVYVVTHKEFKKTLRDNYVSIHAGAAMHENLPYPGDDTGDNISTKNDKFCELTAMYWIWKNSDYQGNIGICHYRRYFINEYRNIMSEEDLDGILEEYDIITTNINKDDSEPNTYLTFGHYHNIEDIKLAGSIIKKLYPEDEAAFHKVMEREGTSGCNMLVTSRKHYDEYCEWLFPILFSLEKQIDVSSYSEYNKRVIGFIAERLLDVYIEARHLKACRLRVGPPNMTDTETEDGIKRLSELYDAGKYLDGIEYGIQLMKDKHFDMDKIIATSESLFLTLFTETQLKPVQSIVQSKDFINASFEIMRIRTCLLRAYDNTIAKDELQYINGLNLQLPYITSLLYFETEDKIVHILTNIAVKNKEIGDITKIFNYFDIALTIDDKNAYAIKNLIPILHLVGRDDLIPEYEKRLI